MASPIKYPDKSNPELSTHMNMYMCVCVCVITNVFAYNLLCNLKVAFTLGRENCKFKKGGR